MEIRHFHKNPDETKDALPEYAGKRVPVFRRIRQAAADFLRFDELNINVSAPV